MLIITFKNDIIIQTSTHFIAAFFNYVLACDCIEDGVFVVVARGIIVLVMFVVIVVRGIVVAVEVGPVVIRGISV